MKLDPTLYEILGLKKTASNAEVREAYRRLSKTHHPDMEGGDAEVFARIKEAFDILSDEARRGRYDATGRTDPSKVTLTEIKNYIKEVMTACVEAENPTGGTDDPARENIREKILLTLQQNRVNLKDKLFKVERKTRRAKVLLLRFKPKGPDDFVGDALRENVRRLQGEKNKLDDMIELCTEAEKVFRSYTYQVGPQPEGQDDQGPTTRRSGVLFLTQEELRLQGTSSTSFKG